MRKGSPPLRVVENQIGRQYSPSSSTDKPHDLPFRPRNCRPTSRNDKWCTHPQASDHAGRRRRIGRDAEPDPLLSRAVRGPHSLLPLHMHRHGEGSPGASPNERPSSLSPPLSASEYLEARPTPPASSRVQMEPFTPVTTPRTATSESSQREAAVGTTRRHSSGTGPAPPTPRDPRDPRDPPALRDRRARPEPPAPPDPPARPARRARPERPDRRDPPGLKDPRARTLRRPLPASSREPPSRSGRAQLPSR